MTTEVILSSPTHASGADRRHGERASWRLVEFITVNIRNANTAAVYRRAAGAFLAWCKARGIASDRKGPLSHSAVRRTKQLTAGPMSRTDVCRMVRRRAEDAAIATPIGCHSFRATGITDYLKNGGRIEVALHMAGHYDSRGDDKSLDEVERIGN